MFSINIGISYIIFYPSPLPAPWTAHPFLIPSNELVVGSPQSHGPEMVTAGEPTQHILQHCWGGRQPITIVSQTLSLSLSALVYQGNNINPHPHRRVWVMLSQGTRSLSF